jgi:hypothetical protein
MTKVESYDFLLVSAKIVALLQPTSTILRVPRHNIPPLGPNHQVGGLFEAF